MIRYGCSLCGGQMESPDSLAGEMDECPRCKVLVRVPLTSSAEGPGVRAVAGAKRPLAHLHAPGPPVMRNGHLDFACPHCGRRLRAKLESVGKSGKCPGCAASVVIPSPDAVSLAGRDIEGHLGRLKSWQDRYDGPLTAAAGIFALLGAIACTLYAVWGSPLSACPTVALIPIGLIALVLGFAAGVAAFYYPVVIPLAVWHGRRDRRWYRAIGGDARSWQALISQLIQSYADYDMQVGSVMSTAASDRGLPASVRTDAQCAQWFVWDRFVSGRHSAYGGHIAWCARIVWRSIRRKGVVPTGPRVVREAVRARMKRDALRAAQPRGWREPPFAAVRDFRMTEARWSGLGMIIIGLGICAWQLYEVRYGDSFTVWIVWFIPLPVILFGILGLLSGVILLVVGKDK